MIRRIAFVVAVLIPALLLGAWLLAEQVPIWTAPRLWWITDAPAACAALSTLTAFHAVRSNETPPIPSAEASNRAEKVVQWQYHLPEPPDLLSNPLLIRGTFNGETRLAWLISAGLEVGGSVVYLDAATGDPLAVIAAVLPNATCPFDVRGALVDMARSRAFLLFAGYSGAVVVGGMGLLLVGWVRSRRGKTS